MLSIQASSDIHPQSDNSLEFPVLLSFGKNDDANAKRRILSGGE